MVSNKTVILTKVIGNTIYVNKKLEKFPQELIKLAIAFGVAEIRYPNQKLLVERIIKNRFPLEYEIYLVFKNLLEGKSYLNENLIKNEQYRDAILKIAEILRSEKYEEQSN